jgi:hypothetical protein
VEFLSLVYRYTFSQRTAAGFVSCVDIWSVILDAFGEPGQAADAATDAKYHQALLSLPRWPAQTAALVVPRALTVSCLPACLPACLSGSGRHWRSWRHRYCDRLPSVKTWSSSSLSILPPEPKMCVTPSATSHHQPLRHRVLLLWTPRSRVTR